MVVPPISPLPMTKGERRRELRQQRIAYVGSLAPDTRTALHTTLAEQVCSRLPSGATIGSYVAIGSEIDPALTDQRAASAGHDIAYPWFADRTAAMQFRRRGAFVAGPFDFPQPVPTAELVSPDVLLVPLTGVDTAGNRLGQGAGHYDRYLATSAGDKSILTIGICYDLQIVDKLYADPWDMPLQAIATPTQWILVTAR